jgi:hypothetical protein
MINKMELRSQQLLFDACIRPQHLIPDLWYKHSAGAQAEFQMSYRRARGENEIPNKLRRRLEGWWRTSSEGAGWIAPSSGKFQEAKRRQFTPDGRQERISKSLAALSQPSSISLTREQWRRILEDPDIEDQSS